MLIEAVVPEPGIGTLHEGVLHRFSRLDEVQSRAASATPEEHGLVVSSGP